MNTKQIDYCIELAHTLNFSRAAENGVEAFLREEADILFTLKEETRQIPGITVHDLYTSHIYLITQTDDPLAEKNLIHEEDLYAGPSWWAAALPMRSGLSSTV